MTAPSSAGREFIADLLGSLAGDAYDHAAEVIERWAGATLYLPARSDAFEQRVRIARLQLAAGADRIEARRVVEVRCRCSERTARDAVAEARRQLQESAPTSAQ